MTLFSPVPASCLFFALRRVCSWQVVRSLCGTYILAVHCAANMVLSMSPGQEMQEIDLPERGKALSPRPRRLELSGGRVSRVILPILDRWAHVVQDVWDTPSNPYRKGKYFLPSRCVAEPWQALQVLVARMQPG